MGLMILV